MAYMSGLTGIGFAATQYALLSSLYALPGKLVSGLSGFMVAAWGFPVFFAMTAAVGIPVVILCLIFIVLDISCGSIIQLILNLTYRHMLRHCIR